MNIKKPAIEVMFNPAAKWPITLDFVGQTTFPLTLAEAKHLYRYLGIALEIVKEKRGAK